MKTFCKPILLLCTLLMIIGCTNNEEDNRLTTQSDQDLTKISSPTPINQSLTNKIKDKILEREDVKGIRGVNTDQEVLLAIEVEELKQFNEQEIEKEIKKSLKDDYPEKEFKVSSDQKIFLELDQLEKQIQNNKVNKEELNKKYKSIKKLLNDPA